MRPFMTFVDLPKLAYCLIDSQAIFLDVAGDRYFRLSPARNADFLAMLAGTNLEPQARAELVRAGIPFGGETCLACEGRMDFNARRQARGVASGPFRLDDVARMVWLQRRIERRIARQGFSAALEDVVRLRAGTRVAPTDGGASFARVLRAFEYSRLLRSPANRCLPRSIAVVCALAPCGVRANLVIGVKLGPFAAHCWAQLGEDVLNDTAEEAARFTPILVL